MQTFKINKNIEVVCESQSTRYGFRHLATLVINGRDCEQAKHCYYNRTWESYEFESVLESLAEKTISLTASEKKLFIKKIKNGFEKVDTSLKTIATIAGLGNIFGQNQKEKNDWKTRILKAGLENRGLIMPDNWNELTEKEKETRLNGAIAQLA